MSIYLNAILMLAATLAAFVVLAKLLQAVRSGMLVLPWQRGGARTALPAQATLTVEQAYMLDAKRRLVLVRCDDSRVLLLTGGPNDLVVAVLPRLAPAGTAS